MSEKRQPGMGLFTAGIAAACCSLLYVIIKFVTGNGMQPFLLVQALLMPIGVFFLLFGFYAHRKNLMKGLAGALLAYQIGLSLSALTSSGNELFGPDLSAGTIAGVLEIVNFAIYALILVDHFLIAEAHNGSPVLILVDRIAVAVLGCSFAAQVILTQTGAAPVGTLELFAWILSYLRDLLLMTTVVLLESEIDRFRLERAKNAEADE